MVQCDVAECTEEGKSQCARCKQRFYCTAACQQKDWRAHKKECKRITANAGPRAGPPPPISPLGHILNRFSGNSQPMSATARFFEPLFGYTAAEPARVYRDLVNAYRALRLGAHANAYRVPPALQNMEFGDWMDRLGGLGVLPDWWDKEVNGKGLEIYVREDAWGRLDRDITSDELQADVKKRMMSLEMIVEKVLDNA
ncbi:hypothetical protein DFH06DRAFT_1474926 [Mycena polygramma]|nr:hypothetical protein DFH06DRAFT_1474926 [Mycena polygramma]